MKLVATPVRRRQAGVSLIEVLVAMLVVSFGILAMTGLLGTSARYGKTSEFRSVATLLAADITDRIRANLPALDPNANPPGNSAAYDVTDEWEKLDEAPPLVPCDVNCSAAQIAAADVAEWKRALYYGLPNGMGYLSYDPNSRSADVWVAWLDPQAAAGETKFGDNKNNQECPPGFRDKTPPPRCLFFRVGM